MKREYGIVGGEQTHEWFREFLESFEDSVELGETFSCTKEDLKGLKRVDDLISGQAEVLAVTNNALRLVEARTKHGEANDGI